jgi:diguanylate cyclase (GGDEF)-like protein
MGWRPPERPDARQRHRRRYGGDEFTVILPDIADRDAVARVVEGLIKSGTGLLSAGIGVALYPQHTESLETLIKYADIAMYVAKHTGKISCENGSHLCKHHWRTDDKSSG